MLIHDYTEAYSQLHRGLLTIVPLSPAYGCVNNKKNWYPSYLIKNAINDGLKHYLIFIKEITAKLI